MAATDADLALALLRRFAHGFDTGVTEFWHVETPENGPRKGEHWFDIEVNMASVSDEEADLLRRLLSEARPIDALPASAAQ